MDPGNKSLIITVIVIFEEKKNERKEINIMND